MVATAEQAHKPDDVTVFLAALDAFAATPARFHPSLMLHDTDGSGLAEYAFRLWCSANRLALTVDHVRSTESKTEYDVLRVDLGPARTLCVFTKVVPLVETREPVPGVVIELRPEPTNGDAHDDSATRFSLLEID